MRKQSLAPKSAPTRKPASEHQLVLLLPGGTGLEAIGTFRERTITRNLGFLLFTNSPLYFQELPDPFPAPPDPSRPAIPRLSQTLPTIKIPKPLVPPMFEATYYPSFKGTRMLEGRIARLPVSAFYKQTITSTTGLELRTRCDGGHDTGMIVHIDNNPLKGELAPIPRGIRGKNRP